MTKKEIKNTSSRKKVISAMAFAMAFILVSCENGKLGTGISSNNFSTTTLLGTGTSSAYKINNVTIGSASSAGGLLPISLYLTQSTSTTALSQNCNLTSGTGGYPCACQFTWSEVNNTTGSAITIQHSVTTPLIAVQPWFAQCNTFGGSGANTPSYASLPIGTKLNISLVAASGNPNSVSSNTMVITTSGDNGTSPGGNFTDSLGNAYQNIAHYACYQTASRGTSITNAAVTITSASGSGDQVNAPQASNFCIASASGSSGSSSTCAMQPTAGTSSQSSYFNFYIPTSQTGSINAGSGTVVCPQVVEGLSGANQYWPLDSNFALSIDQSSTFSIGVDAYTKVSDGTGDPTTSTSSSCSGSTVNSNGTLISSCLGWAAPALTNGSCPSITDSSGVVRPTYRLRKYLAIYPPFYDVTGHTISGSPQSIDTIYVLDRPVSSTSSSPTQPFTMRGPKPCPWAYFDTSATTGETTVTGFGAPAAGTYLNNYIPRYLGTSNAAWNQNNVDGIQYPNFDQLNNGSGTPQVSCSAAVPILSPDGTKYSIGTVNASNPALKSLAIQPINAWTPHYVEDTSFQACAPLSSQYVEAPLHFARDHVTGNVSWCSEAYPSQTDSISQIDRLSLIAPTTLYGGYVAPYTSHVPKNLLGAAAAESCTATQLTLPASTANPGYPAGGIALHPAGYTVDSHGATNYTADHTCDTTVRNTSNAWGRIPLIAPPSDVELALQTDQSYNCTVTFDNGGGKAGVRSPTSGCCAATSVNVVTGAPVVIGDKTQTAHLEPSTTRGTPPATPLCGVPTY